MKALSEVAEARRSRAMRQSANPTRGEQEESAEREGLRAGAILRGRVAALEVVESAAILTAEGVALSDAAQLEHAEATAELDRAEASARRAGRSVGRWTPRDGRYMTSRDVSTAAKVAARAAARQIRAAGCPRLTDEELADLEMDLVIVALERGKVTDSIDGLPAWRACDPERLAESHAACRVWLAAPYGGEPDKLHAAENACRKLSGDFKGAWRAFLTTHARTYARQRVDAYRAQRAAEDAESDPGRERAEAATAEAESLVAAMAERLSLSVAERQAVAAAIDGLTHRMRAQVEGIEPNTARQRAKRGRRLLAERWPSAIALRAEVLQAERAAREAEGPLPAHARTDWIDAMRERAAESLMASEPDRTERPHAPRSGRRLLPLVPSVSYRATTRHGVAALASLAIDQAPLRVHGAHADTDLAAA